MSWTIIFNRVNDFNLWEIQVTESTEGLQEVLPRVTKSAQCQETPPRAAQLGLLLALRCWLSLPQWTSSPAATISNSELTRLAEMHSTSMPKTLLLSLRPPKWQRNTAPQALKKTRPTWYPSLISNLISYLRLIRNRDRRNLKRWRLTQALHLPKSTMPSVFPTRQPRGNPQQAVTVRISLKLHLQRAIYRAVE
jgi:hypothetical protein